MKIDDEKLKKMYTEKGMSDEEIAKHFNVDRTAVVWSRNRQNIEARKGTGDIGVKIAVEKLESLGFEVLNMNNMDKTFEFDLL